MILPAPALAKSRDTVTLGLVKSGIVIEKRAGVGIRPLLRNALTRSEKPDEVAKFLVE